ncbi:MAG: BPL-N domain-containing protein [Candidatus Thermoplasmatota archaeon]|nr:BPL-N domain-containing protein [Candidatus Thermoplasmatota archaeon]
MHLLKTGLLLATLFSLLAAGQPLEPVPCVTEGAWSASLPVTTIHVALYDSISPSVLQVEEALTYVWETPHARYEMSVDMIGRPEVTGGRLTGGGYDVFVIGASGRQYFHGITQQWKNEVATFIEKGGGYVGICGGANVVSLGFEEPRAALDFVINQAALKIVNVYINDQQEQEWQYLWKDTGEDHIPLATWIDVSFAVFSGHTSDRRPMVYGGGPGMYPGDAQGLAPVQPIAVYLEEPMQVAPLHYYRPALPSWTIWKNVTTDIRGQWAGVQTSYGAGRMVLFGNHPEIPPMLNGSIREFFGPSIYGIPRMVYEWQGGDQLPLDYNWWIIRRSAAWTAGTPEAELPPVMYNE